MKKRASLENVIIIQQKLTKDNDISSQHRRIIQQTKRTAIVKLHTHTHTHTHARARTHTHTHILTYTHKHTTVVFFLFSVSLPGSHLVTRRLLLVNIICMLLALLLGPEIKVYGSSAYVAARCRVWLERCEKMDNHLFVYNSFFFLSVFLSFFARM